MSAEGVEADGVQHDRTEEAAPDPLQGGDYQHRFALVAKLLPQFDGKPANLSVKAWLGQVQERSEAHAIRPGHLTGLATGSLIGPASEWWYEYRQTRVPPITSSTFPFTDFCSAITARFARAPELDPRDKLLCLRWSDDLVVFGQKFTQLTAECSPPMDSTTQV